jgi:tetratricopeptide (TPR) repeat protein
LPRSVAPASQSAGQEQQSLWEAVLELVKSVIEHTPLLIVLDDLQWADASSSELLAYLVRRLPDFPIMFVGTCRESELPPRHVLHNLIAHMQREHTVTTLQLQPLSDTQIGTLIGTLITTNQFPEIIVQDIRRQAGGNPFFAEELAYSYSHESPKLTPELDKPQAVRKSRSTLPHSITAALDQRISKLSRDCQQLLGNAAVLGGSFEFNIIRSMASGSSTSVDEDTVLDLLDEALQAGVIAEEGRGARINYHFWQPLLVSHLYNGLSATKRAHLHRRAADILQQLYASREAEGAATITYHLVEGGAEPQQIARYAALAGDAAYTLSAYPEAERYYRIAIEHLGASLAGTRRLSYLLEQLGECLRIQGDYEEARRIYERIMQERERETQRGSYTGGEQKQEAQIDALLWSEVGWTWYYAGDYAHTLQYCERGEQVLHEAGVTTGPAWARLYFQQSYVYWQEGDYDKARNAASEALKLFEEHLHKQTSQRENAAPLTRLRRTLAGDPVDLARTHRLLGALANSVGQLSESLTHMNMALTVLEQHDHKREVAHVCCNMGYVHVQKAEYTLAQEFLRRALSLAEQIGDVPLTAVVFRNLGVLSAHSGDLAEAENWYNRSLALTEQTNDQVYLSMWNSELAAVYQDQGKLAEAATCIRRALSIGRAMNNTPCIGLALIALANLRIAQSQAIVVDDTHRLRDQYRRYLLRAHISLQRALTFDRLEAETRNRGQLLSAQVSLLLGDAEAAQVQALHALKKARQHELTWLVARAQHLLGTILAAQGQQKQASEYFEQAIQAFRKYGMRLELARTLQSYSTLSQQSNNDEPPLND